MNTHHPGFCYSVIVMAAFAIAMAYFEAAVVVYLRQLFYPEGFSFPLAPMPAGTLLIELGREAATLIMLGCVAVVAGKAKWERFGWFLFLFGLWDIGYYVWLKLLIDWPATVFDWDILFLLPLPWIGPVLAPVLIAASMSIFGLWLAFVAELKPSFRPGVLPWSLAVLGSLLLLYSFMRDTGAGLHSRMPQPYSYRLLVGGLACYWLAFFVCLTQLKKSPLN